ncbi:hypothetical protein M758_9G018500 [Ceratodon purpureus]|nr:hypothetical protein M758_9G018500 [Ceratodon purpureus]
MAKKKGGAGRVAKAAGAAAGVSAEAAPPREFNEGDLVLAKVKGWPAWPAQIERLETDGKHQGKYYVTYFGPGQQIGWCMPSELSDFDAEQKEAAIQKSQKKTADKKFISAVKEICGVQDERAGITHKDSGDENEVEDANGGSPEDDAARDSGLDGLEYDMTKEGDVTSVVKHETFMTQVTLNKQDDSVPFNDANPEEDVEDDAVDKDWGEKPEYNGSGLHSLEMAHRLEASPYGMGEEGAKSGGDVEDVDSDGNGGTRRAFRNALKRINETAEKDPEPKREVAESEGQVLTYQYGRKKNRNKNTNLDGSAVLSSAGAGGGQASAEESGPVVAESVGAQKKMKPKVGRPSKASQQAKAGGRDGKANVQVSKKSNGGEKDSKSERDNGGHGHGGGGKYAKDPSNNGHNRKEGFMKKKDMYSSSAKQGGENRERKWEDKKDVKRVASEADRLKKGPKKAQTSSKSSVEVGKKLLGVPKQRDERAKDDFERSAFSGFHGGWKSKGDVKGEAPSKRKRADGEGEGEAGDVWTEGERGDGATSPKTDIDEKHLPLMKRPKMLGSEEKQKHVSVGRPGMEGAHADRDSPRDGKSRERGTSLPPKADKDRMRKAALDGEAALPPSKRRNRAFAAMSACEAEAATASAAESREQAGNGVSGNQVGSNVTENNEGGDTVSPLKAATVTPDISESGDGGHKAVKGESGHENAGGQERAESKRHVPLRETHATDSPSKGSGSEEASKLAGGKLEGRAKSFKSKSGGGSQNPGGHGSPGVAEKRKGHTTGSESGKLSAGSGGGTETFASVAKSSFDDSSIKNAVALANEKRNALKREADSSASMKVLIAAAQAKQRARQYSTGGSGSFGFAELDKFTSSMVCSPSPSQRRGSSGLGSPVVGGQGMVLDPHDRHGGWSGGVDERAGAASMDPAIDTEATIARDTFVGMLETVSRTKESIGRTTRQAMDCAKHGIAEQIVEIILLKLENEPSFHRRVDFWFLLDSVTQVAHTQKVSAFLPIVQASLPRILNAAAPPGGSARENRKQCLKVLNLWLERKVMPESIVRHFMTEIESHNDDKGAGGGGHRRLSRYERGVDDPVRDMDGMLVDEYGSNASLNLPDRFSLIPQLYEDDEEGSEDGDKKAETECVDAMNTSRTGEGEEASERHRTVLEDVDGELEMEDVSPTADSEVAASKERERLLRDRYAEDARAMPGQPPLPPGPPPGVPSPPPLPTEPPPSPPPPPQSPPPASSGPESPYPRTGIPMRASSHDASNQQQSDSPSTPTGYSGQPGQGSLGVSQGGSRSNTYPGGSVSQLSVPVGSPLPPTPSQHSSPGFGQGGSGGTRLPPPPPLPQAYRPQRLRSEVSASPGGECEISPRLARCGEEQVREASGGERGGESGSAQQDGGAAYSGGCTSSGAAEGAKGGDQGSAIGVPVYAANAPVYANQANQDQVYRMNAGVRPGAGAQFQFGPAGMPQPGVRGRPFGGHFSPHAQYQGPPMNPSGSQGPVQMLAFRPGGPSQSSWRPA